MLNVTPTSGGVQCEGSPQLGSLQLTGTTPPLLPGGAGGRVSAGQSDDHTIPGAVGEAKTPAAVDDFEAEMLLQAEEAVRGAVMGVMKKRSGGSGSRNGGPSDLPGSPTPLLLGAAARAGVRLRSVSDALTGANVGQGSGSAMCRDGRSMAQELKAASLELRAIMQEMEASGIDMGWNG